MRCSNGNHASFPREVLHDAALLAALDKLLRFVVMAVCLLYILHTTSCCIDVDTDPWMRLVQSSWITCLYGSAIYSGGNVSDLVLARNCCLARMLPGEAELVSE